MCWNRYQDIAEYAYLVKHNAKIKPVPKMRYHAPDDEALQSLLRCSPVKQIAGEIYKVVLVIGLVVQHKLITKFAQLPYLGPFFFVFGESQLLGSV